MKQEEFLNLLVQGSDQFTIETILFNMVWVTILALFVYLIYKKTFAGVVYSHQFNITIVMIAMITAMIMMLIGSNLAISLGMVGALSIVRFRTAVKEPRDIAFLFWAIAVGLAAGTGVFMVAVIGSLFIAMVLWVFSKTSYRDDQYLLVIKGKELSAEEIAALLKDHNIPSKMRMRNNTKWMMEITYEITLKEMKEQQLITYLNLVAGIEEVHIVSYNGEISG